MMQQQKTAASSVASPHRLLRRQDALAWVMLYGLMTVGYVSFELYRWFTLKHWLTNPIYILSATGAWMAAINRLSRVRRGESVRDVLSYPKKASWFWVLCGGLGAVASLGVGAFFIRAASRIQQPFPSALAFCCLLGITLILSGLLGKWTWREWRRLRHGDEIEAQELFEKPTKEERQKLRWEGKGFIGMGLAGLYLLVMGISGLRLGSREFDTFIAVVMIVAGGGTLLLSILTGLTQKKPL